MLVERVDVTSVPRVTTLVANSPLVSADLAAEDDLDLVGPADVDVVGHGGLEEGPGPAGGVEDDGAGDSRPGAWRAPTNSQPPGLGRKRRGDTCSQRSKNELDMRRAEPVADVLERPGASHEAKPLASSVKPCRPWSPGAWPTRAR